MANKKRKGARSAKASASSGSLDLTSMTPELVAEFLRLGGTMQTASGAAVTETSAMRVAAAWRCINIISGTVGSLPMDLIRREGERIRRPAVGHPLRRLLTVKPNPWQTPSEFRRMLQAHLLLRGNGYAMKIRVGRDVAGLIPILPNRVEVEQRSEDLSLRYKVSRSDGSKLTLGQADMLHLRGMSLDGVRGLSVLNHMRESIGLALQGEAAGAHLMRNGQFVRGVLKHPNKLSQEARAFLKDSLAEHSGPTGSGGTLVLEEGMDYSPVSLSPTDLQFLEQRDFQRYDIAMFFGVPPHMLGATEKETSWGSGIEQQGIGFVTYTLNDWLVTWQEALKRDLIHESEWDVLDFRFNTQALLKGDTKAQWDAFTSGRQWGVYSANDVREKLDLNPRDDEAGDEYAAPPNQTLAPPPAAPEGDPDDPARTA